MNEDSRLRSFVKKHPVLAIVLGNFAFMAVSGLLLALLGGPWIGSSLMESTWSLQGWLNAFLAIACAIKPASRKVAMGCFLFFATLTVGGYGFEVWSHWKFGWYDSPYYEKPPICFHYDDDPFQKCARCFEGDSFCDKYKVGKFRITAGECVSPYRIPPYWKFWGNYPAEGLLKTIKYLYFMNPKDRCGDIQ